MKNFIFQNPTKLIFGKNQLEHLRREIPKYGKNVLLVYGGGSIKRNGIYDKVVKILKELDVNLFELSGVEPNPRIETVRRGVEICKQENVDFLLAVGGGSVIDCTKAIAAGAKYDGDPWDIVIKKVKVQDALPSGNGSNTGGNGIRNECRICNYELGNEGKIWLGLCKSISEIFDFRSGTYILSSERANGLRYRRHHVPCV